MSPAHRHKILLVIGTRPEAIKLAPLAIALENNPAADLRVCLTGQHRELVEQALAASPIRCDYNLDVMTPDQPLSATTARILSGVARVIDREQPDWVVVQGDTTSAMAAALAAYQARAPIAHVEAGLRSGDSEEPWPEEMNRRLIGQLASLHCAPTLRARDNLLQEGVAPDKVVVTGNTIVDALNVALDVLNGDPKAIGAAGPIINSLRAGRPLLLTTVHRRENCGARLEGIGAAIRALAARGDCEIVFPAHASPAVGHLAQSLADSYPNLHVTPPLEYLPFVALLKQADLILTDSGGVQEEAAALGKPVLVLRERTERPEVVEGGNGRVIGTNADAITAEAGALIDDPERRRLMARAHDRFGDGKATARIESLLLARAAPAKAL